MIMRDFQSREHNRPFYKNPALMAWTVIGALALLMTFYFIQIS